MKKKSFDGFWSSSLTYSTVMGKPDTEALELSQRLSYVNDIFEVTTKPLIFDADTGGKIDHFDRFCFQINFMKFSIFCEN